MESFRWMLIHLFVVGYDEKRSRNVAGCASFYEGESVHSIVASLILKRVEGVGCRIRLRSSLSRVERISFNFWPGAPKLIRALGDVKQQ
eukprot:scaffold84632_cov33-Tisochrysis_lutea.AAC.2